MLPFFQRFKKFFVHRCVAARSRRYALVYRMKNVMRHDLIESTFSIERLNLRGC